MRKMSMLLILNLMAFANVNVFLKSEQFMSRHVLFLNHKQLYRENVVFY